MSRSRRKRRTGGQSVSTTPTSHNTGSRRSKLLTDPIAEGHLDIANPLHSTQTANSRPKCFRITGVPQGWNNKKLQDSLISLDPALEGREYQLSLYPACCGSNQVALLNLDACTAYFQKMSPSETQCKVIDGGNVELVIDRHFYGLTPLNTPKEDIVADVIAVTGLAGHAYGSWKSRESPRMWLKDLLPNAVPGLRIMSYGYDSHIVGKEKSETRMSDYTAKFIEHLENATPTNRPIIFIGHSLGGILILQALIELNRSAEGSDRKRILTSTKAIFFAGTPHGGLRTTELEEMVRLELSGDDSMLNLLLQLREGSEYLETQMRDLSSIWQIIPKVVTFYETIKTPVVRRTDSGDYRRDGEEYEMVRRFSAQLNIPCETRYPVEKNHSDMVKLVEDDTTYQTMVTHMRKVAQGIQREDIRKEDEGSKTTASEPFFMVPFRRNPDFIGRKYILEQLRELLRDGSNFQPRAALWGLGGIGKTTIALEFCYRRLESRSRGHIFWVHGNSDETFKASYIKLARLTGLMDNNDEEECLQRVKS